MRKWLLPGGLLAILLSGAVLADVGSSIKGGGSSGIAGTWTGNTELRDPTILASESLANGALTAGTSWTRTDDFALASNAATYTHSFGSGTLNQVSASAAIPWAYNGPNGWFSFTYTTTAVTGSPTCTIPNTFASVSTPLTITAGTRTVVFQVMSGTVGPFTVSCTSIAAATVTFDDLSLKQVNGGTLTVPRILVGSGTVALPGLAFIGSPSTGFRQYNDAPNKIDFVTGGVARTRLDDTTFTPITTDSSALGMSNFHWSNLYLSRSIQGSKTKALTASAATTFVTVAVPQTLPNNFAAGEVIWIARASDATDTQTLSGRSAFNCVNAAGTESCAAIVTALNTAIATTAGAAKDDLACTITAVTGLVDVIGLAANCNTVEMTETSLVLYYRLNMPQVNTIAPQ